MFGRMVHVGKYLSPFPGMRGDWDKHQMQYRGGKLEPRGSGVTWKLEGITGPEGREEGGTRRDATREGEDVSVWV